MRRRNRAIELIDADIAAVPLTRGHRAVIDVADIELIEALSWYTFVGDRGQVYAHAWEGPRKTRRRVSMHRLLLGEPSVTVDHIDGNGLNNRRSNLRLASTSENACNRGMQRNNTTGYKGVSYPVREGRFQAQIVINGRNVFLGYFDDPVEAAIAYDDAARKLHGEFARLNFPHRVKEIARQEAKKKAES